MKEVIEFRIPEKLACRYLPDDLGIRLGTTVRKVEIQPSDPIFAEIGRIDRDLREKEGLSFFTAWIPHRRYSRKELVQAHLVRVKITKIFEPAGEECGTRYDESSACPFCGSGGQQVTPLFLDGNRIPSHPGLSRTIAGEVIASEKLVKLWKRRRLSGAKFEAVRLSNKRGAASTDWYQMNIVSSPVELDACTRVGRSPFDEGTSDSCPRGDLLAYSLLSEASIVAGTYEGSDLVRTRQLFGVRRGLLRPQPLILLSRRAWSVIDGACLKGFKSEVAHLV